MVRAAAIAYIRSHRDEFEVYMAEGEDQGRTWHRDLDRYLEDMEQVNKWGDHYTLIAICRAYNVCIRVLSKDDNYRWRYEPADEPDRYEPGNTLRLYYSGNHYENVVSRKELRTEARANLYREHTERRAAPERAIVGRPGDTWAEAHGWISRECVLARPG